MSASPASSLSSSFSTIPLMSSSFSLSSPPSSDELCLLDAILYNNAGVTAFETEGGLLRSKRLFQKAAKCLQGQSSAKDHRRKRFLNKKNHRRRFEIQPSKQMGSAQRKKKKEKKEKKNSEQEEERGKEGDRDEERGQDEEHEHDEKEYLDEEDIEEEDQRIEEEGDDDDDVIHHPNHPQLSATTASTITSLYLYQHTFRIKLSKHHPISHQISASQLESVLCLNRALVYHATSCPRKSLRFYRSAFPRATEFQQCIIWNNLLQIFHHDLPHPNSAQLCAHQLGYAFQRINSTETTTTYLTEQDRRGILFNLAFAQPTVAAAA